MAPEDRKDWALRLICRTGECENYMSGIGACFRSGRTPEAEYLADRVCNSCLAYFALNGGFPDRITAARQPALPSS